MTWQQVADAADRVERQQAWINRLIAAASANERRSEAIDAIEAEGNFLVRIPGCVVTVARLSKWLNESLPVVEPGSVIPA